MSMEVGPPQKEALQVNTMPIKTFGSEAKHLLEHLDGKEIIGGHEHTPPEEVRYKPNIKNNGAQVYRKQDSVVK